MTLTVDQTKAGGVAVTSVAGKTGAVTLVKGDVGLGSVDNTPDVDKPISTPTQLALNDKMDVSDELNGLASLSSAGGLLEQVTDNVFAIRAIGTAASTSIPALGNVDTRFARVVSGVPTGGLDGDWAVRIDKPFRGALYTRTAGTWAITSNDYTWAGKPAASSSTNAVITITDWNTDFFSNGTNWIPLGKRVTYTTLPNAAHTGSTSESSDLAGLGAIPAGLVIAGCIVNMWTFWTFTGTAGIKRWRHKLGSNTFGDVGTGAGSDIVIARPGSGLSVISVAGPHTSLAFGSNDRLYGIHTSSNAATTSVTADFTGAITPTATMQLGNAADSATLHQAFWEIIFP